MGVDDAPDLREALKTVAVALKRSGMPFALMGGYAAWARGGPEPAHDVDVLVAAEDADAVAEFLADEDLDVVQPPEDWLFKVFADGAMVDIIHGPVGVPAHRADVQRATPMEVLSVEMPVLEARAGGLGARGGRDRGQRLCRRSPLPRSPPWHRGRRRGLTPLEAWPSATLPPPAGGRVLGHCQFS